MMDSGSGGTVVVVGRMMGAHKSLRGSRKTGRVAKSR